MSLRFHRMNCTTILSAWLMVGCVPMSEQSPDRGDIFAPLHAGELANFDHHLAMDIRAGRDDAWTDVGHTFVAFGRCQPLPAPSARINDDPVARLVDVSIRLETHRRFRLRHGSDSEATHTIHDRLWSPPFFDPTPTQTADDLIVWPGSSEQWPDEWPAATTIDDDCDPLAAPDLPTQLHAPWQDLSPLERPGQLVIEWHYTDVLLAAIKDLESDSGPRDSYQERIAVHRADLAVALQSHSELSDDAQRLANQWARRALDDLLAFHRERTDEPTAEAIRIAWLAMELGNSQLAIAHLSDLVDHRDPQVANTARYYIVNLAWHEGWWEFAADSAPHLIDEPASLRPAFAYFAATAHRFAGRDDRFLGLAREALRDRRRPDQDPFLGALYRDVLRELARYDVDDRTIELLEEFGPRAELATRQRELAEIALDAGRPSVAEEMVRPLLDQTRDARQLPALHALLALAAFLRDDLSGFDEQVEQMLNHRDGLESAIPRHRRAEFFAEQDVELARLLRSMLPMMAEWGDDAAAHALRQRWLGRLIEQAQNFLRRAPESAVSESLTDLYHLAGQLLDEHPRGYAKRVGEDSSELSTLVLGTVEMSPRPPLENAPSPQLRWPPIDSLLLIPSGMPPTTFYSEFQARRQSP